MPTSAEQCFLRFFASVPDPRVEYLCDHKLIDIIARALCAVTCGADSWVEVEEYGHTKEAWLRTFLELPHGIPSHDTFGRVFALLDATAFERSFMAWVQAARDLTAGLGPIYLVSAWAAANGVVLGQVGRGRPCQAAASGLA